MPIYEYYCPDNHTIYQFYAKTLAQGQTTPKCPDNPAFRMQKKVSAFAITKGGSREEPAPPAADATDPAEDARMDAAIDEMEKEFSSVDENDPKAMARMMRRMSEVSGEKLEGEMEEVVRKLEEGADPDSLEEMMGDEGGEGADDPLGGGMGLGAGGGASKAPDPKERRHRFRVRRLPPRRDPKLYDY
jgi:hypothetical protein